MADKASRTEHSRGSSKERAFWFYQRAAFPLRDTPPAVLEKHWASLTIADTDPAHAWEFAGPHNVAGRVTSLIVHPENPNRWYAGSAAGGVWRTTDSGARWNYVWSRYSNQNIGALAWWKQGDDWYLVTATGEGNLSGDSYPGSGVYFSRDEGLTWQPLFGAPLGLAPDSIDEDVQKFPRRVGCIATHGAENFGMGSISLDDRLPGGLYLLTPVEGLRPCMFWGNHRYNCHSVLFYPGNPRRLIASVEPGGTRNGIWRSRDSGATWEQLTKGLPSGDQFRRTSLAFAPSDPDVIYAVSSDCANALLGVYRSRNGGDSWTEILNGARRQEWQMSYNNTLAIHPSKPDSMIWGGTQLYRTDDGGRRWRTITNSDRAAPNHVHSDHHTVLWLEDGRILSGNDGGVAVSEDDGATWSERSGHMNTTMFYGVGVAPSNSNVFGGGAQDSGTLVTGLNGLPVGHFERVSPGDGGWICFDPTDEEHVFTSSQNFMIYRHRRGTQWTAVPPKNIPSDETKQRFLAVLAIDPSSKPGRKPLWAGSSRLWRTGDDGKTWEPVSKQFDGSAISAIEISALDPRLMFVGTTSGGVFRSRDRGKTWSQNLAASAVPRRAITSIQIHPRRRRTVVFTVASTGMLSSSVHLDSGETRAFGHVFRSEDEGDTWTDIDGEALPNVVYYAAAWQSQPPHYLFVAGDAGVFALVRHRGNETWINITGDLPSVVISDLVYHTGSRTLTAATYGRGIWRLPVKRLQVKTTPRRKTAPSFGIAAGRREDQKVPPPVVLRPKDGAVFEVFPRKTVVTVRPMRHVIGYQVEWLTRGMQSGFSATSPTPEIEFEFLGAQEGRFRVWALLPNGLRSRMSGWRDFKFLV